MRSEVDPKEDEDSISRRVLKGLLSSGFRRYFIQKYPGSAAERGLRFGSALRGPLVWVMLGEVAANKQEAVLRHADIYRTLVETGTFRGDMVAACKDKFDRVVSVELSEELHEAAKSRFADSRNVELLQGDSTKVLPKILESLNEPALFWLDAHYSFAGDAMGETITPILSEVESILADSLPHRILIDDAQSFLTRDDYPSVEDIVALADRTSHGTSVFVESDIIHIMQLAEI